MTDVQTGVILNAKAIVMTRELKISRLHHVNADTDTVCSQVRAQTKKLPPN